MYSSGTTIRKRYLLVGVISIALVVITSRIVIAQESFFPARILEASSIELEIDSNVKEQLAGQDVSLSVIKGADPSNVTEAVQVDILKDENNEPFCTQTKGGFLCNLFTSSGESYFEAEDLYTLEIEDLEHPEVESQRILFLACKPANLISTSISQLPIQDIDKDDICIIDKRRKLRDLNGLSFEGKDNGFGVSLDRDFTDDGTIRLLLDATITAENSNTSSDGGIKLEQANAKLNVEFSNIYVLDTVLGTDVPNYYPIRGSFSAGLELGQNLQLPVSGTFTFGVPYTDTLIHTFHRAAKIERQRFPMLFSISYEFAPMLRDSNSEDDRNLTHRLVLDANYNIPILQRMDLELDWTGTWLMAEGSFESNFDTTFKVFFQEGYDSYLTFGFETGADAPLFTDASTIKVGYSTVLEALLGSLAQPKEEE